MENTTPETQGFTFDMSSFLSSATALNATDDAEVVGSIVNLMERAASAFK